jgi:alkyl sulfatase BDS1-like metallo-beta-lactamase superfamily hydrolase
MGIVKDLSENLLAGRVSTVDANPVTSVLGLEPYSDKLAFVSSMANSVVVQTSEGLLLIDTGNPMLGRMTLAQVREWTDAPLHSVVYTHGHIDHVMGTTFWDTEAQELQRPRPTVYAHRAVVKRFDRYVKTSGYNGAINARQFRGAITQWPTEYRHPDKLVDDTLLLRVGKDSVELNHARGETDDHLWLWLAEHETLCTGDLFIWASPNCGNPQKVQRYPLEWANALEAMREKKARLLCPGHGPPIEGAARVDEALKSTAELLRTLHDQCLRYMNEGLPLSQVIARVEVSEALLALPWLRPVYDKPTFILRNIWRLYGGWWDGDPAHLEPPAERALAQQLAELSGGAHALIDRAMRLSDQGEHALACQLAEWAMHAESDSAAIRDKRAEIYERRADSEQCLMARGVYFSVVDERSR